MLADDGVSVVEEPSRDLRDALKLSLSDDEEDEEGIRRRSSSSSSSSTSSSTSTPRNGRRSRRQIREDDVVVDDDDEDTSTWSGVSSKASSTSELDRVTPLSSPVSPGVGDEAASSTSVEDENRALGRLMAAILNEGAGSTSPGSPRYHPGLASTRPRTSSASTRPSSSASASSRPRSGHSLRSAPAVVSAKKPRRPSSGGGASTVSSASSRRSLLSSASSRASAFSTASSSSRYNMSFTNDRVKEIERENRRLLGKIVNVKTSPSLREATAGSETRRRHPAAPLPKRAPPPSAPQQQQQQRRKTSYDINRRKEQDRIQRENQILYEKLTRVQSADGVNRQKLLRQAPPPPRPASSASRRRRHAFNDVGLRSPWNDDVHNAEWRRPKPQRRDVRSRASAALSRGTSLDSSRYDDFDDSDTMEDDFLWSTSSIPSTRRSEDRGDTPASSSKKRDAARGPASRKAKSRYGDGRGDDDEDGHSPNEDEVLLSMFKAMPWLTKGNREDFRSNGTTSGSAPPKARPNVLKIPTLEDEEETSSKRARNKSVSFLEEALNYF